MTQEFLLSTIFLCLGGLLAFYLVVYRRLSDLRAQLLAQDEASSVYREEAREWRREMDAWMVAGTGTFATIRQSLSDSADWRDRHENDSDRRDNSISELRSSQSAILATLAAVQATLGTLLAARRPMLGDE